MNPEINKTILDFVNGVVGQVILSVFVLNTETTKIKTENQLSIVKNFQTIIIEDLGLEKKIVITIDTMAITSEMTLTDHILRILDSSIIEQIVSIDLDLKVLDQEIEISIRFNDQNNPNRYNTYNTTSNNYNQNRNRSNSIPNRNRRSFSQDNYRMRYQNRPHENKFPSYNNQARSLGDSKPSSRENSRDRNPKVQFSENKIHGYYSDDEGEELT